MSDSLILVTGGSGFIAGHCILQLLERGYRVRTTVRSLTREARVRDVLTRAGMTRGDALEFVAADLTRDDGWADTMAGVDVVLHVASPVRPGKVADESEVIGPARDGALRVLRAARDAGVRRVVLTSAFQRPGSGTRTRMTGSPRTTGRRSTAPVSTRTGAARSSPSGPPGSSSPPKGAASSWSRCCRSR